MQTCISDARNKNDLHSYTVWKNLGKCPFGRPKQKCKNNIRKDLRETSFL
jgi:hypothetical protein